MDVDILAAKGLRPENVRSAFVRHFGLHIGNRATLVPRHGSIAHGFVMRLAQADIKALYSGSSVQDYRPEAVLAETTDGGSCAALCFNVELQAGSSQFNAAYAQQLQQLARRLNLPAEYVDAMMAQG
jgi:hypothetical protein